MRIHILAQDEHDLTYLHVLVREGGPELCDTALMRSRRDAQRHFLKSSLDSTVYGSQP